MLDNSHEMLLYSAESERTDCERLGRNLELFSVEKTLESVQLLFKAPKHIMVMLHVHQCFILRILKCFGRPFLNLDP